MAAAPREAAAAGKKPVTGTPAEATALPCGTLGRAKISRLLLGGNLIGGYMHCRDLKYVNSLFRAYATDEKILETLAVAERHGINTVFETGGDFVRRYNRQHGGHMQFIPHIEIKTSWSQRDQDDHIAVGMFDFQVKADAELAERAIRHHQKRERPWRA